MNYRKLGNSGLRVSEVSIGAWLTYGSSVEDDVAIACIHRAVEHGVNFIDVADAYGRGGAELVVGRAIKGMNRDRLVISSKLYWPMSDDVNDRGLSRKHIMTSVEASLKRLGTDYLDLYFCHRYDPETPLEETVRAMDDLVHQGKVLYWGTSVWTAEQLDAADELCRAGGYYRPQVEQPRYNIIDDDIERDGVLDAAGRLGMGLVVWSPLAQGLLSGKYNDGVPAGSRGKESNWLDRVLTDENIARVRQLSALANELGMSTAQLALAWCLRHSEVSSVITGATRPAHVDDNVRATELASRVDASVAQRVGEIFSAAG